MADLVIDAAKVRLVRGDDNVLLTAPAGEVGAGGQYFRLNTTTGKVEKGNATTAAEVGFTRGVLLDSVSPVNVTATIALIGSGAIISLGDALDALAFDAAVYVSNTDGTLADAAGTVSSVAGRVVPGFNQSGATPDKLLRLSGA